VICRVSPPPTRPPDRAARTLGLPRLSSVGRTSPHEMEEVVMPTARGPMDVDIEGEPPFLDRDGLKLNRNIVRKEFSGDMVGTSEAQMIAAFTSTPGSAGYVAIEHFTGSVSGKSGSFVLQHSGVMNRGDARLTVTIVPDSGSGELAGISGTLQIDNDQGQHSYVLEYEIA